MSIFSFDLLNSVSNNNGTISIIERTTKYLHVIESLYPQCNWLLQINTIHFIKRIPNWPLYKIWYYATYLMNVSKSWLHCIVQTNLSIKQTKKCFQVHNCPCGTVGANKGYELGLLVHGKVVVEFCRRVFRVYDLLWKTCSCTRKCNHSRKHNCEEVSKWRHSVVSFYS